MATEQTRREFLSRAIQLAIATSTLDLYLPRIAFADDKEKRAKGKGPGATLVVIFLRGGCDPAKPVRSRGSQDGGHAKRGERHGGPFALPKKAAVSGRPA